VRAEVPLRARRWRNVHQGQGGRFDLLHPLAAVPTAPSSIPLTQAVPFQQRCLHAVRSLLNLVGCMPCRARGRQPVARRDARALFAAFRCAAIFLLVHSRCIYHHRRHDSVHSRLPGHGVVRVLLQGAVPVPSPESLQGAVPEWQPCAGPARAKPCQRALRALRAVTRLAPGHRASAWLAWRRKSVAMRLASAHRHAWADGSDQHPQTRLRSAPRAPRAPRDWTACSGGRGPRSARDSRGTHAARWACSGSGLTTSRITRSSTCTSLQAPRPM
jgi:hypothetical protein